MHPKGLSRRSFLRGAAGVSMALPVLEAFSPRLAYGQAVGQPKRFLLFFHPQGTVLDSWLPQGSETSFSLPEILAPIARFQDRSIFVAGIDNRISERLGGVGDGHQRATVSLLTASGFSGNPSALRSERASIDQVLASRISDTLPRRALNLAVGSQNGGSTVVSGLFHRGANDPVESIAEPQRAFDTLFSEFQAPATDLGALRSRRQSVLDAVQDSLGALRRSLGRADQQRLDAHADKIRELESRLGLTGSGSACTAPSLNLPGGYNYRYEDNVSATAQIDLMVAALACDITRVGTLHFDRMQDPEFPWLTVDGGPVVRKERFDNWHNMVHDGRDEAGLRAGFRWYAEQYAYLLDALGRTADPEGGTLLDTTMVLWLSDFGNGYGHNTLKLPVILSGHTGPTGPGRFINHMRGDDFTSSDYDTGQLYVSILRAFGFSDNEFGTPGVSYGTVPGLA
jgi:hypothetical protein